MEKLESLEHLIEMFNNLQGIGRKTAERLAYNIINMSEDTVIEFSKSLIDVKQKVHQCTKCGMLTEHEICEICSDIDKRSKNTLIVVSTTRDALAIEKSVSDYKYHVLNGDISLVKNITPDKLNIDSLIDRIENEHIEEIILANNPTIEGETTARYISSLLKDKKIKITRLATGMPMGGEIDYQDTLTIKRALSGRTKIE